MRDVDASLEAVTQGGVGYMAERAHRGVLGLVDVQVEIEPMVRGEREQAVEGAVEFGDHEGRRAQDAAVGFHGCREIFGEGIVEDRVDGDE